MSGNVFCYHFYSVREIPDQFHTGIYKLCPGIIIGRYFLEQIIHRLAIPGNRQNFIRPGRFARYTKINKKYRIV